MKKTVFIFLVVALSSIQLFSQITDGPLEPEGQTSETDNVFTVIEVMPEFPGGEKAFQEFMKKNLTYPTFAKEQGIQGKVYMSFVVQKDGSITNVEVLRGIGGGCDEEAIRVIKLMPNWIPGKQAGKEVPCKFRLPVNFTLK